MLFHVAVRSLCAGSEERLFLEEPEDSLLTEIPLTYTSPEFTARYLASFREALPDDETKAVLQDRLDTGWLAWGKTMEVLRLPGWEENVWHIDESSKEGIKVFEDVFAGEGWWQQVSFVERSRGTQLTEGRSPIIGPEKIRGITPQPLISTLS
jgi:proteasome activator subunit 4